MMKATRPGVWTICIGEAAIMVEGMPRGQHLAAGSSLGSPAFLTACRLL
jgi:hypothetical protein